MPPVGYSRPAMAHPTITTTDLQGVTCIHRGKVRDVYAVGEEQLLLISTDRLSAFDCVLPTPIPDKGRVLTQLSRFWFNWSRAIFPNHVIATNVAEYPDVLRAQAAVLEGRSMLVKRTKRVDIECVARGYLAGSGYKAYQDTGTVFGQQVPKGLLPGSRLPAPLFTPTTKADAGHDEPLMPGQLEELVGARTATDLRAATLQIYDAAHRYALERGIILADTKLEFGVHQGTLILIDEMLTPDSSRFWDAGSWQPGKVPENFDKQHVRDHLEKSGWNKLPPAPALPQDVVQRTQARYLEAYQRLTGEELP